MLQEVLLLLGIPCLILSAYVPGTPGAPWSLQDVLYVKAKLRSSFTAGGWNSITEAHAVLGIPEETHKDNYVYTGSSVPSAPKILRLAFHDCLKYTDGTGGCDGCINWEGVGVRFPDVTQNKYEDVKFTNNNGLRPTVEFLEAIYTVADFPKNSPVLAESLQESGKSRADLWALAALVAVEWGVETNNMKCNDPSSVTGQCHHLQGEDSCHVALFNPLTFRTGRADCEVTDAARPYVASKEEVHPNAMSDGQESLQFFQSEFGLNGQESVALLGAHTFGRFHIDQSLFRYVWTSRGHLMFNNDYYKMITDKERWFFDDNECTKVTDSWGNKPPRRWVTHFRGDTKNNGPVHWISESYVCPNCAYKTDDKCCQDVPEGHFCTPDATNFTMKTPKELNGEGGLCEKYIFISGVDEMALNFEIGLYFDFKQVDGYPTGCPGFDLFKGDGSHWSTWSMIGVDKADPQCPKQSFSLPKSDQPTSWYMEEYARNQDLWISDFSNVLDKMQSNGYSTMELTPGEDQWSNVSCSSRTGTSFAQCWVQVLDLIGDEFIIMSKLDGRVVQINPESGDTEMWEIIEDAPEQKWRWSQSMDQLVNSGTGQILQTKGIALWQLGEEDKNGYSTLQGKGMQWSHEEPEPLAMDRNWGQENGQQVGMYKEHGAPNQMFKLQPVVSDCNTVDETPFYIENDRTGQILSLDSDSGVVTLASKNPEDEFQLWQWAGDCQYPGESFLISSGDGTVLAAAVTSTNTDKQGNAWLYDVEQKTLKSSVGYPRAYKKGATLRMAGSLRFVKKTGAPWLWFQWTLKKV